jgi:hypothetical protein
LRPGLNLLITAISRKRIGDLVGSGGAKRFEIGHGGMVARRCERSKNMMHALDMLGRQARTVRVWGLWRGAEHTGDNQPSGREPVSLGEFATMPGTVHDFGDRGLDLRIAEYWVSGRRCRAGLGRALRAAAQPKTRILSTISELSRMA